MSEFISIRGARENNLKDVSLQIPKRKITVFTGVSGSGKSSIVFDTIASEAQRQLYENFSAFIRGFLPRYPQPEADSIENLSMAVIVDQKRLGGGSHSTVGTITDIYSVLRLLFSRLGQPQVGASYYFSFNDPNGMCPECNGLGKKMTVAVDKVIDMNKSLNEGAIMAPFFASWEQGVYKGSGYFDNDKKLSDYTPEELDLLLYGKGRKIKMNVGDNTMKLTYNGVIEKITQSYVKRDIKTLSERTQKAVMPYLEMGECPLCYGARLNQAALTCKIDGRSIADMAAMEVEALIPVLEAIDDPVVESVVATLVERLRHMVDIGLGYLSLDRETDTLSGGESQRIKMVKHLSSSLVDVTYIFDEPSVGLHPRDVHRLNELLQKLRDKGNTIIVVEHDPDVIKIADHIVDVGPHAGVNGGQIMFEGTYQALLSADTLTGRHLKQALPLKESFRRPNGSLPIKNATLHNLKNVSVDIPSGIMTVVTGVAGSGKSSLINQVFLQQYPDAVTIDQSAVGANRRSNPATYTGIMDTIRKLFAKANGAAPGMFSFNSVGACDNCQGAGVIYTDLAFLDGVQTTCEVCQGKRFKDEVLAMKVDDKSISDVLEMTVEQALAHFTQKDIVKTLQAMSDVGIGYLTLGQPLNTLSGGECQRIKLASELHKQGSVYVMDEPTTGLHMSDITHLLAIMNRLVDAGNTVVVIEHNLDVIRNADWIIDMGPEGGSKGGQVLFEGTPDKLRYEHRSLTSKYI
ncbi:excinuclease ABC subunit UvrA [Streptomyces caniscabiei]|uniref:excinuclease ABC subunit UvrA n=1 Tax=Streptomyces caniscabiei TaxID=2746961 RepID=UPI0029A60567|nr:excinuclease ABC subunit UvrA [Streptomyces caniscabiei]MDX2776063.1 excinuclease ABC subunit UvrA [Streptomyces caniscabiei]